MDIGPERFWKLQNGFHHRTHSHATQGIPLFFGQGGIKSNGAGLQNTPIIHRNRCGKTLAGERKLEDDFGSGMGGQALAFLTLNPDGTTSITGLIHPDLLPFGLCGSPF